MNGTTLKALRLALGFTQEEAARMIGAVSMRSWRYWEDEGRTIPQDVVLTVRELVNFKYKIIREVSNHLEAMIATHGEPEKIAITYYSSLETWMTQDDVNPTQWKPHCMAMATIAERFQIVNLIAFDATAYQQWLGLRLDNSALRAQWAATHT